MAAVLASQEGGGLTRALGWSCRVTHKGSDGKEVVGEAIIRDKVEEGGNRGEGDGTTGGGCEGSAIGLGNGDGRERMELAEVSDGREGGLAEEDDGGTRVSDDGWGSRASRRWEICPF